MTRHLTRQGRTMLIGCAIVASSFIAGLAIVGLAKCLFN